MTTPGAVPRAEGSKPLRVSKAQRRAQQFLDAIHDIDQMTGAEIMARIDALDAP